jgi:hypothetical protein
MRVHAGFPFLRLAFLCLSAVHWKPWQHGRLYILSKLGVALIYMVRFYGTWSIISQINVGDQIWLRVEILAEERRDSGSLHRESPRLDLIDCGPR